MSTIENMILSTSKIYIRPIEIEDIDRGWLDWVNDKSSTKFLTNVKDVTRGDLIKYVENSESSRMFAVCMLEGDRYVGNARLSSIDWENHRATYGRLIGDKSIHNKGIGTDTLALLAHYAFNHLNLNRIQTGVISTNIASIKSNEKFGANNEGIFREFTYINGKYEDVVRFGILKRDFNKSKWQKIILRK